MQDIRNSNHQTPEIKINLDSARIKEGSRTKKQSTDEVFDAYQDITSPQGSMISPGMKANNTQVNSIIASYQKPANEKILNPNFLHSKTSKSGQKQSKQSNYMNKYRGSISSSRYDRSSERSSKLSRAKSLTKRSITRRFRFNRRSSVKVNISDYVGIITQGKQYFIHFWNFYRNWYQAGKSQIWDSRYDRC